MSEQYTARHIQARDIIHKVLGLTEISGHGITMWGSGGDSEGWYHWDCVEIRLMQDERTTEWWLCQVDRLDHDDGKTGPDPEALLREMLYDYIERRDNELDDVRRSLANDQAALNELSQALAMTSEKNNASI